MGEGNSGGGGTDGLTAVANQEREWDRDRRMAGAQRISTAKRDRAQPVSCFFSVSSKDGKIVS